MAAYGIDTRAVLGIYLKPPENVVESRL